MGIIRIDVRKLDKERKMQQRKQQGQAQGTGAGVILLLATLGAFWLFVGVGIGWLIWH